MLHTVEEILTSFVNDEWRSNDSGYENSLDIACRCAVYIYLKSFSLSLLFRSVENQTAVRRLQDCISKLQDGPSLEMDREIYVWLCFTGAMSSRGVTITGL